MRKVTIVITLLEECKDIANCEIEKEIKKALSEQLSLIPWAKDLKSVTVE